MGSRLSLEKKFKTLGNEEVTSFLAKDDALEDLSFATVYAPGEGSEIGLGLDSWRMWGLGFYK